VYTQKDRGYYATNLTLSISIYGPSRQGYLVNGAGDCGLYKNENGRWSAKYFTEEEMLNSAIEKQITKLVKQTQIAEFKYRNNYVSRYTQTSGNSYSGRAREYYNHNIEAAKKTTVKSIKKMIAKFA
jgi:hypothetical protein